MTMTLITFFKKKSCIIHVKVLYMSLQTVHLKAHLIGNTKYLKPFIVVLKFKLN